MRKTCRPSRAHRSMFYSDGGTRNYRITVNSLPGSQNASLGIIEVLLLSRGVTRHSDTRHWHRQPSGAGIVATGGQEVSVNDASTTNEHHECRTVTKSLVPSSEKIMLVHREGQNKYNWSAGVKNAISTFPNQSSRTLPRVLAANHMKRLPRRC